MNTIIAIHITHTNMVSSLTRAGFHIVETPDKDSALALLPEVKPDAILVSEDAGTEELCRCIRGSCSAAIIVLGNGDLFGEVTILEAGADAYLKESINHRELVARLHSIVRRYELSAGSPRLAPPWKSSSGGLHGSYQQPYARRT